jgi:hypothetical protein
MRGHSCERSAKAPMAYSSTCSGAGGVPDGVWREWVVGASAGCESVPDNGLVWLASLPKMVRKVQARFLSVCSLIARLSLWVTSRMTHRSANDVRDTATNSCPQLLPPSPLALFLGVWATKSRGLDRPFLKWRGPSMPWHEHPPRYGRRRKVRSALARRLQYIVLLSR